MRSLDLSITLFTCASGAQAASPPKSAPPAEVPGAGTEATSARTPELHGIRFAISEDHQCPTVTITPSGLEIDNSPLTRPIEGRVKDAEIADLDVDQSPEIYVYLTSDAGDSLVALSANKHESLSDIYLPPLDETPGAAEGYRGRDAFAVGEGRLLLQEIVAYIARDSSAYARAVASKILATARRRGSARSTAWPHSAQGMGQRPARAFFRSARTRSQSAAVVASLASGGSSTPPVMVATAALSTWSAWASLTSP